MAGASIRPGLCRCHDCEKRFTVTVGTIFEDTHLPLAKWVKAFRTMASRKRALPPYSFSVTLGSGRAAWRG
jgi:transposase-like protein